jgi:hypothetical protein
LEHCQDILDGLTDPNASGQIAIPDPSWTIIDFDTVLMGLNGYEEIDTFPYVPILGIDTEAVKAADPDRQIQLLSVMGDTSGRPADTAFLILVNLDVIGTLPKACQSRILHEATVWLDGLDAITAGKPSAKHRPA